MSRSLKSLRPYLLPSVALLTAVSLTGLSATAMMGRGSDGAGIKKDVVETLDGQAAASMLYQLGLSPEVMTAAGFTGADARTALQAALTYPFIEDAATLTRQVNAERERTFRPPAGEPRTPSQLRALETSLKTRLDHAFAFLTANLPVGSMQLLTNLRANAKWDLPTQYLVVNRTPQEWLALRGALARKRHCVQQGIAVPAGVSQLIAAADADPAVTLAAQRLQGSLAGVRQSWDTELQLNATRMP